MLAGIVILIAVLGVRTCGDSNTYYSMIESLINEGDFIVDNRDLTRWQHHYEHHKRCYGPSAVSVVVSKQGTIRYAKPIIYPFVAAVFFFLLGETGLALLNGLFLGGSILLCVSFLGKYFSKRNSFIIAIMFFFGSFMPAYLVWVHPEMMLFFACVLCMWLWLSKGKIYIAALAIAMAASVKIVFVLMLLPIVVELISKRRFKELTKTLGVFCLGAGAILGITYLFFGQISPYAGLVALLHSGVNSSLVQLKSEMIIYPPEVFGFIFDGWRPLLRSMLNFFIGRFTGIVWYAFPSAVCAAIYFLKRLKITRQEKLLGDSILLSALLVALTLVVARPNNYFGGLGFVCNRYFFIVPILLFLPTLKQIKNKKTIVLMFLPGMILSLQVISHEYMRHPRYNPSSLLKFAPLEIYQVESMLIFNVKMKENIVLYIPAGPRKQIDRRILINAGDEIVIVQHHSAKDIKLTTNYGDIVLQAKAKLKNRQDKTFRSFYHFKACHPTWINNISAIN